MYKNYLQGNVIFQFDNSTALSRQCKRWKIIFLRSRRRGPPARKVRHVQIHPVLDACAQGKNLNGSGTDIIFLGWVIRGLNLLAVAGGIECIVGIISPWCRGRKCT